VVSITDSTGSFALNTGKKITLSDANAKIEGKNASNATVYDIRATAGAELTAGETSRAVVFKSAAIEGTDASYAGLTGTATAATLAFGAQASTLTIKVDTEIKGVILDVSAFGSIVVEEGIELALVHNGTSGQSSGGIFTKAGGALTVNAVKANGTTLQGNDTAGLTTDTAAGLAAATVAKTNSGTSAVGTDDQTEPASGTITPASGSYTITQDTTFTASTNEITPAAGT
jgi:hypothetical protein